MKTFVFFLLSFSLQVQAFTLNNASGASFSQDDVKINVEGSSPCTNLDLTNEELLDIAADGMDQFWNKAPTSRLHISKGSVVQLSNSFHTETMCTASTNCTPNPNLIVSHDILISCNESADFSQSSVLGLTLPNNTQGRTIVGALVLINGKANSQLKTKTRHEKMTIIAHEVGHALGLGHSRVIDSLMYYAHNPNRNYLGQDDIDGIAFLYPAEQPKIGGCGTISNNNTSGKEVLLMILGILMGMTAASLILPKRSSTF